LLGDSAENEGNGVVDICPVCVFAYITGPDIVCEVDIDELVSKFELIEEIRLPEDELLIAN
jgi:hypothetical protein